MATVSGSITSLTLVGGTISDGTRKALLLNCSFGQYTAADTAVITGVTAAIAAILKNGKTIALKGGLGGNMPGIGSGGTSVFASAVTAATATISCNLGSQTTADASTPASQGVSIYVTIEES